MAYPAKVMAYFRGGNKISNQKIFSGGAIHIEYTFILKKIGESFKYCRSKAKSSLPPLDSRLWYLYLYLFDRYQISDSEANPKNNWMRG